MASATTSTATLSPILADYALLGAKGVAGKSIFCRDRRPVPRRAGLRLLVPNRFEYGYGLTPEIVAAAAREVPDLLITRRQRNIESRGRRGGAAARAVTSQGGYVTYRMCLPDHRALTAPTGRFGMLREKARRYTMALTSGWASRALRAGRGAPAARWERPRIGLARSR
jgi:hypothetical protein